MLKKLYNDFKMATFWKAFPDTSRYSFSYWASFFIFAPSIFMRSAKSQPEISQQKAETVGIYKIHGLFGRWRPSRLAYGATKPWNTGMPELLGRYLLQTAATQKQSQRILQMCQAAVCDIIPNVIHTWTLHRAYIQWLFAALYLIPDHCFCFLLEQNLKGNHMQYFQLW